MIPDKIYVHIGPHLGLLNTTIVKTDAPGEQEYIRKDALLEWAQEYLDLKIYDTKRAVMEELIDKLNEM